MSSTVTGRGRVAKVISDTEELLNEPFVAMEHVFCTCEVLQAKGEQVCIRQGVLLGRVDGLPLVIGMRSSWICGINYTVVPYNLFGTAKDFADSLGVVL